jgi:hypothetical protein
MQRQNISIATLIDMYKRGEMRLPEIQRHYVWRSTRVCGLLDSLYRGSAGSRTTSFSASQRIACCGLSVATVTFYGSGVSV